MVQKVARTRNRAPSDPHFDQSAAPGNVAELMVRYRGMWPGIPIAPGTQWRYAHSLRAACALVVPEVSAERFGLWQAATVTRSDAQALVRAFTEQRTPKSAVIAMVVLCAMWNTAMEGAPNPFAGIKKPKTEPPRSRAWTPAEIRSMIETAEKLDIQVVAKAMRLAGWIAQRPCDILALKGKNYDHGRGMLVFTTRKTRETAELHLPEAAPLFAGLKPEEPWLTDPALGPITTTAKLAILFRHVRAQAPGVRDDLWLADMRRTVLTEMADLGATDSELMAISRHRNREQLQIYIRRTPRQASSALELLRQRRAEAG